MSLPSPIITWSYKLRRVENLGSRRYNFFGQYCHLSKEIRNALHSPMEIKEDAELQWKEWRLYPQNNNWLHGGNGIGWEEGRKKMLKDLFLGGCLGGSVG